VPDVPSLKSVRGRTWVTRKGIHVDRICSAWLIRRFIDPDANLKYVEAKGYTPAAGELRFDMFDAEFTHEGEMCTFEVLLARMGSEDSALRHIADMVHDIDLRDAKFAREELTGFTALITGICLDHRDDDGRLARRDNGPRRPLPSLPAAVTEAIDLGIPMRTVRTLIIGVTLGIAGLATAAPSIPKPDSVAIPDGERGIGYDDLQYAPEAILSPRLS
jgi:hypothetical protein